MIADWECWAFGDPAWDVASVACDFVWTWLQWCVAQDRDDVFVAEMLETA